MISHQETTLNPQTPGPQEAYVSLTARTASFQFQGSHSLDNTNTIPQFKFEVFFQNSRQTFSSEDVFKKGQGRSWCYKDSSLILKMMNGAKERTSMSKRKSHKYVP